jgi:pimeloyl-ACP methyl ester carboxylesterase
MPHLIIIPGLSDRDAAYDLIVKPFWPRELEYHLFKMNWRDGQPFAPKLKRLLDYIDTLAATGDTVSVLGMSAGGSAAVNALAARPDKVHAAINVCGRLRAGDAAARPTLEQAAHGSTAFVESVRAAEQAEHSLSVEQRARIMTLQPWRDGVVPSETVALPGAVNRRVIMAGHMASIGWAMLTHRHQICSFA